MLATIFLFGAILGFFGGRMTTSPTTLAYNPALVADGTVGAAQGGTANTVTAPPTTLQTTPSNDYSKVTKSTDSDGHFALGNKDAKVKIVEFGDFQCPFCYRYFISDFAQILKEYVVTGKVYYSFHNYPLNIHPQAPKAAEAALCAADQDKYWEYHDLLFENQNLWSGNDNDVQVFSTIAQGAGLDGAKLAQCITSGKYTDTVNKDIAAGDKKGISGTPTIFINDQKVVGAQDYYTIKQTIEEELAK